MWKKKVYIKNNLTPFSINRTKIDLFFDCSRCFYLDQKYGIKKPHGTPLVINNFVVNNYKTILNEYRLNQKVLPESKQINKILIPSNNTYLEDWIHPFKGIYHVDKKTNFKIKANLDDIWQCKESKKYFPVIIKSTSRKKNLNSENIWPGYWKQLSLYSFLLSKNSMETSSSGILVYLNVSENLSNELKKIDYELLVFERNLDLTWIEPTFDKIYNTLNSDEVPLNNSNCKYCRYQSNVQRIIDGK